VNRSILRLLGTIPALLLVLGAAACGGASNNDSGGTAAVVTPFPAAAGTPGAAPAIIEVATDNKFSVTKMAAPAGRPLTVAVQNKGAIHNWHLQGVTDGSGRSISTPLQQGPNSSSVTFSVSKPGTYKFICDAHPSDMKGTLVIQ